MNLDLSIPGVQDINVSCPTTDVSALCQPGETVANYRSCVPIAMWATVFIKQSFGVKILAKSIKIFSQANIYIKLKSRL